METSVYIAFQKERKKRKLAKYTSLTIYTDCKTFFDLASLFS